MAVYQRFTTMKVWKMSKGLAGSVYVVTSRPPFSKDWALRDQLRKAAISVPSNIAEGFERGGTGEFLHFLSIAKGSNGELITQLHIAYDLNYLDYQEFINLSDTAAEVGAMLGGLMKYLRKSGVKGAKYRDTETEKLNEKPESDESNNERL